MLSLYVNNHPNQYTDIGGAISLFQSNAYFNGICYLHHNHAENGGGLVSRESKVYVRGSLIIAHNTVTGNGGGVYLSNSELNCQRKSSFILNSNRAEGKGGGLHAISSTIKATSDYLQNAYIIGARASIFHKNAAKMGGGLSLEANAKLYILKYKSITLNDEFGVNTTIFTFNHAC